MTKTFELEMRIRNNRIKSRRVAMGMTSKALAEIAGVTLAAISNYENMTRSPLVRSRDVDGWSTEANAWSKSALKLAFFFKCPCDELWPESVLAIKKSVITAELSEEQISQLAGFEHERLLEAVKSPEESAIEKELARDVSTALEHLPPRNSEILSQYFGLGGRIPMTLREVGLAHGISYERVREIINSAILRLRKKSGLAQAS